MKKVCALIIFVVCLFTTAFASTDVFAPLPDNITVARQPHITATNAIVVDVVTNTILYDKNKDAVLNPASTSKIMTALLAIENISDLENTIVTVSSNAVSLPKGTSVMGLKKNDKVSALELLYGIMLPSGADATNAIAEHISGSIEAFVELMNKRAAELGMVNTHFANTHGLTDPEHYTTAYDMALLTLECLKHPLLISIASTCNHEVVLQRGQSEVGFSIKNNNALLHTNNEYFYDGVKGLKTGSTSAAGECLLTYYEKDGRKIMVMQFHSDYTQRYPDAVKLLDYAVNNFATINLTDIFAQRDIVVQLPNAQKDDEFNGQLALKLDMMLPKYYTTTKELATAIMTYSDPLVIEIPTNIQAPIYTGDIVGTVSFKLYDEVLYSANAYASRTVYPHVEIPEDMQIIPDVDKTPKILRILQSKLLWAGFITLVAAVVILFITINIKRIRKTRINMRKANVYSRKTFRR